MKKQVIKFIESFGATAKYSGNDGMLYIFRPKKIKTDIEAEILKKFGYGLPFGLTTTLKK